MSAHSPKFSPSEMAEILERDVNRLLKLLEDGKVPVEKLEDIEIAVALYREQWEWLNANYSSRKAAPSSLVSNRAKEEPRGEDRSLEPRKARPKKKP